jgi:truncated hemoglobin YjbI
VATLYDGLAGDTGLRPLFDRDLTAERKRQELFFAELLGGPATYSDVAWSGLAHRHGALPITRERAGLWLKHFRRGLEASIADAGDRKAIFDRVRELAFALVNEAAPREGTHGICLPSVTRYSSPETSPAGAACRLCKRCTGANPPCSRGPCLGRPSCTRRRSPADARRWPGCSIAASMWISPAASRWA